MDRHIIGTFTNEEDTVQEVKHLIDEEGYSSDELALVIDKHSNYEERLNTLKEVQVEQVEVEDGSVWDRIKDTFSFGSYDSKASHSVLEDYGVPHNQADHYMGALKDGEIILLANTDAPRSTELSEVNEEIVAKERNDMVDDNKKEQPIDEVNSEEEEAIKNKGQKSKNEDQEPKKEDEEPKNVETSETEQENMGDSIDPSQADHTRKDNGAEGKSDSSNENEPDGEDLKQDQEEDPDLTGEEETVDAQESKHGHGNKIAEGVVKPEAKSPLNTEGKEEKDPSEKSEAPESDANYPQEAEDAGMKSEE